MLVSGGKVIAIDSIKKNNTNKSTLSGDGVWTDLGVNTDNIATTAKVESVKNELNSKIDNTKRTLENEINTASANLKSDLISVSSKLDKKIDDSVTSINHTIDEVRTDLTNEINKKQDKLKFDYNEFDKIIAIGPATGTTSALAGGNNVEVSAGLNTRVDTTSAGEKIIYTVNVTANPTNVTVSGENGLTARRDNQSSAYYLGIQNDYINAITSVSSKLPTNTFESYTATADVTRYTQGNYITINDHVINGYDWSNTIKDASANAVNTVEGKFEGTTAYTAYSGIPFVDNTTPKWSVIGDGNRINVTSEDNKYKVNWNSAGFATEQWVTDKNYLPKSEASSTYLTIASAEDIYQKKLNPGYGIEINESDISVNIDVVGDIIPYSAGKGIKIDEHIVSISADYLSANALDEIAKVSANWNTAYETLTDNSARWDEVSAKLNSATFTAVSSYIQNEIDYVSGCVDGVSAGVDYVSGAVTALRHDFDEHNEDSIRHISSDERTVWNEAAKKLVDSANYWNDTYTSSTIWNKTTDEFNTSSKLWNDVYGSATLWNEIKTKVDTSATTWNTVTAKLNTDDFTDWSANYNETITAFSAEFTAHSADDVRHVTTEDRIKWNTVTDKLDKDAFDTWSAKTNDWDKIAYSGRNGIKVQDHWIEVSADYALSADVDTRLNDYYDKTEVDEKFANFGGFVVVTTLPASGDNKKIYLINDPMSPNPDQYKEYIYTENVWKCIGDTSVDLTQYYKKTETSGAEEISIEFTNTSAWANETFQPIGDYVTSGDYITPGLAWTLVNKNDSVQWSGLDVSELGKKYIVTSTNNTVYVGSAQNGNTITYNLSANIPTIPGISGENGLSAFYDIDTNKYYVGVNNSGMTYYRGVADLVNDGIVQFTTNNAQVENITVNNGVFTLPSNVAKVTFSINEKIENNISTTNNVPDHNFNLNNIALYCNDSEVISTQEYYHNELGLSELSLTYTIDNSKLGSNVYSIRYGGVPLTGTFKCNLSILEEVLSFNEGGGTASANYEGEANNLVHVDNTLHKIYADPLTGIAPIYVSGTNMIGLNFDPNQFTISGEGLHSTLQIKIETSGGTIDQEAFEKMADLVNSRMTETIPIGMINNVGTLGAGASFSYLFRPVMEFDAYSGTVARVMTSNGTVGTSQAQVVISEVNETNGNIYIQWWSDKTTLTAQAGTVVLTAAPGCTDVRTLHPEKLYYATVINYDQTTHYLGFKNDFTTDIGTFDVAYYDANAAGDYGNDLPSSLNGVSPDKLGQTAGATLKPYIGFRNEG